MKICFQHQRIVLYTKRYGFCQLREIVESKKQISISIIFQLSQFGKLNSFLIDCKNNFVISSNELLSQIKDGDTDSRKFFLSTQLVFGTLQLFKIQIDKLFGKLFFLIKSF